MLKNPKIFLGSMPPDPLQVWRTNAQPPLLKTIFLRHCNKVTTNSVYTHSLCTNQIGDEGMKSLSTGLEKCTSLQILE